MYLLAFKFYGPSGYAQYSDPPPISFVPEFESMGLVDKDWSAKIDCLASSSPAVFSDGVKRDSIGVLSADWMGHEAGTPVISGQKDGVELYAVVTNAVVDLNNQPPTLVPKDINEPAGPPMLEALALLIPFADLGLKFAEGFAESAGAAVFQKLFPEGSPPSLKEIAATVRGVMRQELDQKALDTAQGQTQAVIRYMSIDYPHLGGKPEARDQELAGYVARVELDILPPLQSHAGFSAYLIAAGIHLQMLQERVQLLPHQKDRVNMATTVLDYVKIYSTHLETTLSEIISDRLGAITRPRLVSHTGSIDQPGGVAPDYWEFCDNFPTAKSNHHRWFIDKRSNGGAEKDCKAAYQKYLDDVHKQLDQELQPDCVKAAIAKWRSWQPK